MSKEHELMTINKLQLLLFFILFSFFSVFPAFAGESAVTINEIFVYGRSNYPDWIELYNNNDVPVNLKNYILTDNLAMKKWRIESDIVISAHGYKLFYCDGKAKFDHANFRLNDISGEAALFNPDGEIVDSVTYADVPRLSSIARYPDGIGLFYISKSPTKSIKNSSGTELLNSRVVADIKFSRPSGVYSSPFELELSADANIELYYTTDGNPPDRTSKIYEKPLEISETTALRVAAFSSERRLGEAVRSYILREKTNLPVISLITNSDFLWDEDIGIYTDGEPFKSVNKDTENWRENKRRPVFLDYLAESNSWSVFGDFRIYGGASRGRPQKSFAVYTSDKSDPYKIKSRLFEGSNKDRFAGIILRNGGDDWLWGQIRDGFAQTVVENRAACDILPYQPVVVYLNGVYWGLYGMRELPTGKNLLASHGLDLQKTVILDGGDEVRSAKGPFKHIKKLSAVADYRTVLSDMDMDSFLDYLIVELYSGNTDWPANNIKCWKSQSSKWKWILFDLDRGFNGKGSDPYDKDPFQPLLDVRNKYNLNFPDFIRNEKFKRDFCARMVAHILTTFNPQRVLGKLDEIAAQVRPEMKNHIDRWRWDWKFRRLFMSVEKWEENVEDIRYFAQERPAAVLDMLDKHFSVGKTQNTEVKIEIKGKGDIFVEGLKLDNGHFKGGVPNKIILKISAVPAEGYRLKKWGLNSKNILPFINVHAGDVITECAIFEPINNQKRQ